MIYTNWLSVCLSSSLVLDVEAFVQRVWYSQGVWFDSTLIYILFLLLLSLCQCLYERMYLLANIFPFVWVCFWYGYVEYDILLHNQFLWLSGSVNRRCIRNGQGYQKNGIRIIFSISSLSRHLVSSSGSSRLVSHHRRRHSSTHHSTSQKAIKQGKSSSVSHYPSPKRLKRERGSIPFHTSCRSWSHRGYRHRRRGSCCALCRCRWSSICSNNDESQVASWCWGIFNRTLEDSVVMYGLW